MFVAQPYDKTLNLFEMNDSLTHEEIDNEAIQPTIPFVNVFFYPCVDHRENTQYYLFVNRRFRLTSLLRGVRGDTVRLVEGTLSETDD
jgi:hypothetical protein